jgi:hypothetical protein|tara:strand:- start:212 stop:826 length:615 start_codon:yes stop_codon:yes gene_type:complete
MDNNLLIYTAIVVVVVIACAVWIIWKLRKNSIHIMEELDDESDHNQKNLKTINENVIETNELLKTYNKVVEEKTAELKKYRDGGELAKEKGLFNSLIEILEFIKKFSETSDNLDERTKNYIIAIKDKLDIVLTNSGIEQFNPELNQNVLEAKGCSSNLETKKTKDPAKVNLIANIVKPGYRLQVKEDEFILLKNAEVQVYELEN